jgi:hypothetical protein
MPAKAGIQVVWQKKKHFELYGFTENFLDPSFRWDDNGLKPI